MEVESFIPCLLVAQTIELFFLFISLFVAVAAGQTIMNNHFFHSNLHNILLLVGLNWFLFTICRCISIIEQFVWVREAMGKLHFYR